MTMMFEVDNLEQASPATVSRCGMVFMEPDELGWRPIVTSWIAALPDADGLAGHREHITGLFEWLLPPLLALARKQRLKTVVPIPELALVASLLSLYGAALTDAGILPPPEALAAAAADEAANASGPNAPLAWRRRLPADVLEEVLATERARLEAVFVFSLIWSLGGALDGPSRTVFDGALRRVLGGQDLGSLAVKPGAAAALAAAVESKDADVAAAPAGGDDGGSGSPIRRKAGLPGAPGVRAAAEGASPPEGPVSGVAGDRPSSVYDWRLDLPGIAAQTAVVRNPKALAELYPAAKKKLGDAGAAPGASPTAEDDAAAGAADAPSAIAAPAPLSATAEETLGALRRPGLAWLAWAALLSNVPGGEEQTGVPEDGSGVRLCPVPPATDYTDILIPTAESVSRSAILELLVRHRRHVLIAGPTGTGKSVSVSRSLLPGLDPAKFLIASLQVGVVGGWGGSMRRQHPPFSPARSSPRARLRSRRRSSSTRSSPSAARECSGRCSASPPSSSSTTSTCPRRTRTARSRPLSCCASGWTTAAGTTATRRASRSAASSTCR